MYIRDAKCLAIHEMSADVVQICLLPEQGCVRQAPVDVLQGQTSTNADLNNRRLPDRPGSPSGQPQGPGQAVSLRSGPPHQSLGTKSCQKCLCALSPIHQGYSHKGHDGQCDLHVLHQVGTRPLSLCAEALQLFNWCSSQLLTCHGYRV